MSVCPCCSTKLSRQDASAACSACKQVFHLACIPGEASSIPVCVRCSALPASSRNETILPSTSTQMTPDAASNKRPALSPPSPNSAQVSKALCTNAAASPDRVSSLSPPPIADAPEWFNSFANYFFSSISTINNNICAVNSNLSEVRGRVEAISSRFEQVESTVNDLQSRVAALEASSTTRNAESSQSTNDIAAAVIRASSNLDACEALLTGLPIDLTLPDNETINRLFTSLGASQFIPFVTGLRPWNPARANVASVPGSTQVSSARGSTVATGGPLTKGLVIRFISPSARDQLVAMSPKLNTLTCQSLFNCGGSLKLHLRSLLPKDTHELWRKAVETSTRLGYARPVIRGSNVYVRETSRAELILITRVQDLNTLPPRAQ